MHIDVQRSISLTLYDEKPSGQYWVHYRVKNITVVIFQELLPLDTVHPENMHTARTVCMFVLFSYQPNISGPRLNIKTVLSTYGDFHVKDRTAVRTSYL